MFFIKIILGILCILLWLFYYNTIQKQNNITIFIIDMQESMGQQDIVDRAGLSRTRQQAAMQYIFSAIQGYDGLVAMIRLWYYPDYILPPTHDSGHVIQYIKSLVVAPLASEIVYSRSWVALADYVAMVPGAHYILLTDKTATQQAVSVMVPWLQTVIIGKDIRNWEDVDYNRNIIHQKNAYLWWIFAGIILVWLLLL
jgi:hypothetical protein